MFNIAPTEILLILVVALIVLGPKNLPKIARTLGKGLAEFRRVSTDFQRTINTEIELEEHEKRKQEAKKEMFDDAPSQEKAKGASKEPDIAKAPDAEEQTTAEGSPTDPSTQKDTA